MNKYLFVIALTTIIGTTVAAHACDTCLAVENAKAKVEYTYKLWKNAKEEKGYDSPEAKAAKKANQKAWDELEALKTPTHKGSNG